MKKLLGIVVLGLLFFNINSAVANNSIASFYCDTIGTSGENNSFKIDLDKKIMQFGIFKYKITSITDQKIRATTFADVKKILSFNRYTGELSLIAYQTPPFYWHMKCKKLDKTKKIF